MSSTLAAAFRRLHTDEAARPLVLPNAWDAVTARLVEEAGAAAIASTSSGVSWALGRHDGHGLQRHEMVDAIRRMAAAVRIPLTADIEGGYGFGSPSDVAETVRQVIGAGAVGVNLEDTMGRTAADLLDAAAQAERLAAARRAAEAEGVALFVNARVDIFLRQVGAPEARLEETVRRARAYLDAGADGIFVPGVRDAATIGALARAIEAPLNVLAAPGSPDVAALRSLCVARVSVGPHLALAALATVRRAARELLASGSYESLRDELAFGEVDALLAGPG
jgi:2-methylisocitrate lyase-like PEP mutase family enzyme